MNEGNGSQGACARAVRRPIRASKQQAATAQRARFRMCMSAICVAVAGLLPLVPRCLCAPSEGLPLAMQPARAKDQQSAQQLVREVVWNEVQDELRDNSYWRYRELQVVHGVSQLLDVYQTKYGEIHRLLEIDGRPLTPTQLRAEDARIQRIVDHPGTVRSAEKERQQDADEERKLLKMLPNAFLFHYEGTQGPTIKLSFVPNPGFHASDHESEVFHHMKGALLVDARVKRLVEINGRLTSEVKFGYGLLGHLDAGGTFHVEQRDVGGGHWEMVRLHVDMSGKALFFRTIAVHEDETYSDFHEVSGNATLAEAAQRLKHDMDAMANPSGT
jgi:hypothetical protein